MSASEFRVSVITPVYNAAEFVTRAVVSALAQPETGEVLLIEDNSPDNSLEVCQELAARYDKVKLLRHPDGGNHGAGASRNLGMKNAAYEFIAFLDADDFYLPGRFSITRGIFVENPDCQGVYESIGDYIENDKGLNRWIESKRSIGTLKGLSKLVRPEELAHVLISGSHGGLHLDGLLLKRNILLKSGYMNESLKIHQDSDFIIRMALIARLMPGRLDSPVALRGIHDHNRISAPRSKKQEYKYKMAYWLSLYYWSKLYASNEIQNRVLISIVNFNKSHKYFNHFPVHLFPTTLVWATRLMRIIQYPKIVADLFYYKKISHIKHVGNKNVGD